MARMKAGDSFPVMLDLNADITGASTVSCRVMNATTSTFAFAKTATVVDAPTGVISFTPTTVETATPGGYFVETLVVFGGGAVQRFPGSSYNELVIDEAVPAA